MRKALSLSHMEVQRVPGTICNNQVLVGKIEATSMKKNKKTKNTLQHHISEAGYQVAAAFKKNKIKIYLQSGSTFTFFVSPFLLKSQTFFYKMAYFFLFFQIFYWLIVKQIEAFQRSGIQLENGNQERLFIMWCSHDYNLHQLEFHQGHSEY